MATDIFSMTQEEFREKARELHAKVKEENASYGLPTTGYSETHKCVVDTYEDGRIEMVDIKKAARSVPKNQHYFIP